MSSFAPTLRSLPADAEPTGKRELCTETRLGRRTSRRLILLVQFAGYLSTALTIAIYGFAGDVSPMLAVAFAASGALATGIFLVLSETHVSNRFDDHYMAMPQVAANVAIQIAFLIVAPEIGYLFICALFLIFAFGALRMTTRQAVIAWTLMTACVTPVFMLSDVPISMPASTYLERIGALTFFVMIIGQCAFVGLFSSSLRKQLFVSRQDLQKAYKRIEELAEIDELTGTHNRRSIMRSLDEEIARATRLKLPCSVALIDLDWFKRVNDAFGHPAGDEVLRTFAIAIFANIRSIDAFGRYGGEEFLMVFPDTPHDEALQTMNRLRIIISELDWSALSPGLSLTISAGTATLLPNETAEALLARADAALYNAKRHGRNRIDSAA